VLAAVWVAFAAPGWSVPAGAAQDEVPEAPSRVVVVVSKQNPVTSLTLNELRRIFLRKMGQWSHGGKITVFERPLKSKVRAAFVRSVYGKKPEAFQEYWMNLSLTRGIKAPKVLRSPKLVRAYLNRVKGGVGYLYEDEVDDSVKVVEVRRD